MIVPGFFLSSWAERGQFGDTFGSINSLFTGFAFAGVIYTIILQRQELTLQREELRLQREEMAASRQELATQSRLQRAQLVTSLSELRIRLIEAEIPAIEMEALQYNGPARATQSAPHLRDVANRMQEVTSRICADVDAALNRTAD